MANLNLSEFGEKLFVADADHTFIWDTQNAISKRVSRNSWLNSGTLTSDAPVTISQTWNGTGSTVFKALVVNATTPGTTSSASSLLLDLQVGTVSQFKVTKAGAVIVPSGSSSAPSLCFIDTDNGFYKTSLGIGYSTSANTSVFTANYNGALGMLQDMFLGWSTAQFSQSNWDVRLYKDGAGQLALRNGAAAQTFRIYNTTDTGVTTYERAALGFSSNVFRIVTENLAGVTAPRDICLNSGTGTTQIAGNGISTLMSFPISFGGTNTGTLGYTGGAFRVGTVLASPCDFLTSNLVRVRINDAGNVGIGTTSPTSKLHVAAGDVEVDTIAKGVILKSPDGTRYRVTVANGGTLSVAAV